jgi:hypothetical protein
VRPVHPAKDEVPVEIRLAKEIVVNEVLFARKLAGAATRESIETLTRALELLKIPDPSVVQRGRSTVERDKQLEKQPSPALTSEGKEIDVAEIPVKAYSDADTSEGRLTVERFVLLKQPGPALVSEGSEIAVNPEQL